MVEHNEDALLPPHDPDLIYPGQTFELPATEADKLAAVEDTQQAEREKEKEKESPATKPDSNEDAEAGEQPPDNKNEEADQRSKRQKRTASESNEKETKEGHGEDQKSVDKVEPMVATPRSERSVSWVPENEPPQPAEANDDSWIVDPIVPGEVVDLSDGTSRQIPFGLGVAVALASAGIWVV